jgi:hypothetical protein
MIINIYRILHSFVKKKKTTFIDLYYLWIFFERIQIMIKATNLNVIILRFV